jgi:hypothetical protein
MSLASELQALERELAAVAEHQGGVIVERLLDVVRAFRGVVNVTPPPVLEAVKAAALSVGLYVGKKMTLGYPMDRAIDKLLAEVKTNAPSLASLIAELQQLLGSELKRAA